MRVIEQITENGKVCQVVESAEDGRSYRINLGERKGGTESRTDDLGQVYSGTPDTAEFGEFNIGFQSGPLFDEQGNRTINGTTEQAVIRILIDRVESLPADPQLTKAVVALGEARDAILAFYKGNKPPVAAPAKPAEAPTESESKPDPEEDKGERAANEGDTVSES